MRTGKRIIREFKTNFARYFVAFLVVLFASALMSAYISASNSIGKTIDVMKEKKNQEDGSFISEVQLSEQQMKKIEKVGAAEVEEEAYIDVELEREGSEDAATVRLMKVRENINMLSEKEGKTPTKSTEIAIDPMFAEANDYRIDDVLEIGNEKYAICGIVTVPDYIFILPQFTSGNTNADTFCLAFVTESTWERINEKYAAVYSYSYVFKDNNGKTSEITNYLKHENISFSITEIDSNPRTNGISDKLATDRKMGAVIGILVIIIIAFLLGFMEKKKIEEDCREIGTLFAMGYYRKEIVKNYIALPVAITVIGTVFGWIIGVFGLTKVLAKLSYSYYCFPNLKLDVSAECFLVSVICPIVFVAVIDWSILNRTLKVQPLKMLQNDLKKEHIKEFKINFGSYMTKFRIRVFVREIGNYIILVLGIIIATFLLIMGLGMYNSIGSYVKDVENSILSEYMYLLNVEVETGKECEKFYTTQLNCTYEYDDTNMPVTVMGLVHDTQYFTDAIKNCGKNEVVISDATAMKFDLKKGDTMIFTNDEGNETYKLTVSDIVTYSQGLYAYMPLESLNNMLGNNAEEYNGYLSNEKLDDIEERYIASVTTKQDMINAANNYFSMTFATTLLLVVCSMVIFLGVLFILLKVTIERNTLDISLNKILGYLPTEIKKMYFGSCMWVTLIGLIIAVPANVALMTAIWPILNSGLKGFVYFRLDIKMGTLCVIIGMFAYMVTYLMLGRKIDKISMVEILKGRE